jgi:hypothetical protein
VIVTGEPRHRDEQYERLVDGRFVAGFEPGPVNGFDPAHAQRGSLRMPAGGADVRHAVSNPPRRPALPHRVPPRDVRAGQQGCPALSVTF